ncbi:MAG: metallophosphatase family protein [Chitinispirillaceae bacterium]|nr:metallophosphatase family protein [Chitinispirillaceae bacterium]
MRYGIISDIHGNLEALEAVLADMDKKKIDSIISLGDIVGYYPNPEECIKIVREKCSLSVAGNHDYAAVGRIDTRKFTYYAYAAMEWTKQNISDESKEYLESLPLTVTIDNIFFTHSSPSNPEDWAYVFPDSEEAVFEAFNSLEHKINFIGHTHWPSIMIQDGEKIILYSDHTIDIVDSHYYLVNAGSVGQPRDFDSRSSYVILDTKEQKITIIRVEYDYRITQNKIKEKQLPVFLAERLEKGR